MLCIGWHRTKQPDNRCITLPHHGRTHALVGKVARITRRPWRSRRPRSLGVLDQMVDGLGATDGLADGRHAAIGDELGLGSLDVLDASLLELSVDVVLGDLNLELAGESVESQGLTATSLACLCRSPMNCSMVRPEAGSQVSSVMPRAARLDRKFWPSSSRRTARSRRPSRRAAGARRERRRNGSPSRPGGGKPCPARSRS